MAPKEDPRDKRARLRERRIVDIERGQAAQENAASLTSDLRAIYDFSRLTGPRK